MKMFIVINLFFSISLLAQVQDCYFSGSGFSGKREPKGKCVETREVVNCMKKVDKDDSISSNENKLNVCLCALEESSFYKKVNDAYLFKTNQTPEALKMSQENFVQKNEKTRKMYKDLCYPTKLIEMPDKCVDGLCMKYYAVYRYSVNNNGTDPKCILTQTNSNYFAVGEKFNFPGALNGSGLFLNLIEYSAVMLSDYEPINPMYINDKASTQGALNCSGSFSQVAEEKHLEKEKKMKEGAIDNNLRLPANKEDSYSSDNPSSVDSANPN